LEIYLLLQSGEILTTLVGHTKAVITVFVDEGRIYTGSEDQSIRVWDMEVTIFVLPYTHFYRLVLWCMLLKKQRDQVILKVNESQQRNLF
jgi:WD40 repeat protein